MEIKEIKKEEKSTQEENKETGVIKKTGVLFKNSVVGIVTDYIEGKLEEGVGYLIKKAFIWLLGLTTVGVGVGAVIAQSNANVWIGHGEVLSGDNRRFELTVEERDDTKISGHVNVSYLYRDIHDTDFEGLGKEIDGDIIYEISFEKPLEIEGYHSTLYYDSVNVKYDVEREEYIFDGIYEARLMNESKYDNKTIKKNSIWSGKGEDSFCSKKEEHIFQLDVSDMSKTGIKGKLVVKKGDEIEHESQFTGRSHYVKNEKIYYEIKLDTVRIGSTVLGEKIIDCFWLIYDMEIDQFQFGDHFTYSAIMQSEE